MRKEKVSQRGVILTACNNLVERERERCLKKKKKENEICASHNVTI